MEPIPLHFARQAGKFSRKTLFLVKREGSYQPISWDEAYQDVLALASFLLHHQINPGERILILSENRPEWAIADIGIQSVGAWTVPIYPTLTAEEITIISCDCQPTLAIASNAEQAKKLLLVAEQVPSLQAILICDPQPSSHPRLISWSAALEEGRKASPKLRSLLEHRLKQLRLDDAATLIYTSGTTGEPKGVMLSHRNFLSDALSCLTVIPVGETDLHLSFLPLSHVFERMAGWYLMLSAGACVAYAENMEKIPQNMAEVRPTVMLGVPRFFEKLYARINEGIRQAPEGKRKMAEWALKVGQQASEYSLSGRKMAVSLQLKRLIADRLVFHKLKGRLGGRLRFFVSGGAPLSKAIGEFFYSVGVTIIEGYGLTETSPVIAVNRLTAPRFGSVGQVIPEVEVWIADDGEVLTRGPHVMQGYYKKLEATANVIVDGWFHTGDIGFLDREGYLFITDRKKDLIKTAGGKFVAPQKLEGLFVTDPFISQVFIYGDRQPYCVALIVPNAEQLKRYAQEQQIAGESLPELVRQPRIQAFYWEKIQAKQKDLASFEQVKKIALLDQEFSQASGELTPTLKAKRAIIAKRYENILQGLYESPNNA